MRLVGATMVACLLMAGCGSDDDGSAGTSEPADTTTTEPATHTVSSDDGGLAVDIPDAALPDGTSIDDISITTLGSDALPGPLAGAEVSSAFYSLEPDGLEFAEPVTVTRRFDAAQAGIETAPGTLQSTYLLTSTPDGDDFALLDDQVVEVDGTDQVVTATTTHFSYAYAFRGSVLVEMDPVSVSAPVGHEFDAEVRASATGPEVAAPAFLADRDPGATSVAVGGGSVATRKDYAFCGRDGDYCAGPLTGEFVCATAGDGTYAVTGKLVENLDTVALSIGGLIGVEQVSSTVRLTGDATCAEADVPPESGLPSLDALVVCWVHTPTGSFPSLLRITETFTLPLDAGATTRTAFGGANNDEPVEAPVEGDTATVEIGIPQYANYDITELELQGADGETIDLTEVAQELLRQLGGAEVTAQEGCVGQ
jgi:hypothetical protein